MNSPQAAVYSEAGPESYSLCFFLWSLQVKVTISTRVSNPFATETDKISHDVIFACISNSCSWEHRYQKLYGFSFRHTNTYTADPIVSVIVLTMVY